MKVLYFDNDKLYGKPKQIKKRTCKYCGKEYTEFNTYNGYCSWTCKSKHHKERVKNGKY